MLPLYEILRTAFDGAVEAQNRTSGRDIRLVSERFEELMRDADALIESIGEAEMRGDITLVAKLNDRYRRIAKALKCEVVYLQTQGLL